MSVNLNAFQSGFLWVVSAVLIIMVFIAFFRTLRGPQITDRILSVNMIGSLTMMIISVLSVVLAESYLADINIIYAMISFLAVVVLCKIYMGVYNEKKNKEAEKK